MRSRTGAAGGCAIRLTGCDSGGREGVTFHAYDYWRGLRAAGEMLHRRFALVKGDGSKSAPRAQVTWPDSSRRDRMAAARGDVPVVRFNSDLLKDQVAAMLGRRVSEEVEGGGMIRYPHWTPDWFYTQMTNETRGPKGWENNARRRNESWTCPTTRSASPCGPPTAHARSRRSRLTVSTGSAPSYMGGGMGSERSGRDARRDTAEDCREAQDLRRTREGLGMTSTKGSDESSALRHQRRL